jgi:aryl-alcohol dehydrogenase-like predicted oxidoreductase
MRQRAIGRGGPEVGEIGLGCMGMSFAYGPRDDEESTRTLRAALDAGVTLFDTADMYGQGHNESLIGRVLGGRRDEFLLATKFGFRAPAGSEGAASSATPGIRVDTSPEYVRQACDASLSRLGFERIDLYYAHRRDPGVPIEDTVGAMADLVAAGKVAHLGLSEVSVATLRAAHAVHPIAAVQMEYSLFTRDVEVAAGGASMLDTCRELGIGLVAYSPVGRGLLTGAVTNTAELAPDDFRRTVPRFDEAHLATNVALVEAVRAVADEIGVTPAQAALAWLLAQDELVIPIPGTKRVRYLTENTAAADVELTPAQLARIDSAAPPGAVAGDRYTAASMRLLGH